MGGIPCDTREISPVDFVKQQWGVLTGTMGEETWNVDVVFECSSKPKLLEFSIDGYLIKRMVMRMYNVIYCLFDSELKPLNNDLKSIVIEPKMMDAEKSKEMAERISSIILKEKTVLQEKGECLEGFDIGGHNYLADIELIESSEGEALYQVVCYDFVKAVEKIMMVIKDRYELTKREFEAFRYLVGGFDTADIAGMMFISQATTKKHLNSIYQKLGIKGRHQLIRVMMRHGVSE